MRNEVESVKRADQRVRDLAEEALTNQETLLVETDVCNKRYIGSSLSHISLYRDQDDNATACSDMISTGQSDPSVPGGGDESTTRKTENNRNRALSSSRVNLNKQEWSYKKPKAVSSAEINQAKWDALFKRLLKYKEEFGDCLVPNRYEADSSLGAWVSTQRR